LEHQFVSVSASFFSSFSLLECLSSFFFYHVQNGLWNYESTLFELSLAKLSLWTFAGIPSCGLGDVGGV
jgi:hypothetical protein